MDRNELRTGELLIAGLLLWLIADVGPLRVHADETLFHQGYSFIGGLLIFWAVAKAALGGRQ